MADPILTHDAPPSHRVRLATVLREEAGPALDAALKAEGLVLAEDARERVVAAIVAGVDKLPDRTVHWLTGGDEATLRAACRDMARRKLSGLLDELRPRLGGRR